MCILNIIYLFQVDNFRPENESQVEEGKCKKVKKPRRVLHFSDGILEEYSTDEEDDEQKKDQDQTNLINPVGSTH